MKKLQILLCILICAFLMSGCFKRDDLEDVDIYTTVYPVEYVTDFLYGYNSNISSIYPAEINPDEYTLTSKQVKEYASGAVFVYNGLSNEKSIARDLLNENEDIKIIDVSQGLEYVNSPLELWINPRDYLMLAHNVKKGLEEHINNKYIIEEIDKNYEDLKVLISGFDVELKMIPENAVDTNIIVASDTLSFLTKYGFTVTTIDETTGDVPSATLSKAKRLIQNKTVKYIFMLDDQEETETVKTLVEEGAEVVKLRSMTLRTEDDIANNVTYKTMMRDNIDALKKEVYKN